MSGPLDGVRVLDLSRVLAGPYCAMMLGDAGADVVKVEPPGGDDTRAWGPPHAGGEAAYYLSCNRNKRSIAVHLGRPEGQALLLRLARTADVLIENFRLGTMERWGLGYEAALQALNPRLVYCNISGFGRTGPYADLPGYDFVIQAMGGLMSITGEKDGPPQKVGVAVSDLTTGMMAAYGIMAALFARERTGVGQRVDLSLLETQVAWLANVAANFLTTGATPGRYGNAHPNIVPYQALQARDAPLVVAVGNDQQFRRFCDALSWPELSADPRFATNEQRVINRDPLLALLEPVLAARPAAEWVALLREHGVPCGPVNTVAEVFGDPQVLNRQMLVELPHPTAGTLRLPGIPVKFGATPGAIRRHPPLLGEQSREILQELGYGPAEIGHLIESGIVRERETGEDERA